MPIGWLGCLPGEEAVVEKEDAVLLVDDNQDLLDVHAEVLLTLGGLRVYQAHSGSEALSLYDSIDPALVIIDEGLADMGGSEFLRQLRLANTRARRPALFVTGARSSVRCLPGDVVLEKPVEMQCLLDAVKALVPASRRA
jgi:DNA-binding response OmpR family regulator